MIVCINCGSSSVQGSVYQYESGTAGNVINRFRLEIKRIPGDPALIVKHDEEIISETVLAPNEHYTTYIDALIVRLAELLGDEFVDIVAHRVVHGGQRFISPTFVTAEVLQALEALVPLAPLHQPWQIEGIRVAERALPSCPQVACFDTAFHQTMNPVKRAVALPRHLAAQGLQRYGFHGLSFESIAGALPDYLPENARKRVIAAHLGSGASLCGMCDLRSVETTMGMTPLDGLMMGTRSGSLDPGIVLHLIETLGMEPARVRTLLYERSGLLGVSGISNDLERLLADPSEEARFAVELFVHLAVRNLGAVAASLEGVNAIVFTGGAGFNSPILRAMLCSKLEWLGARLDPARNRAPDPFINLVSSEIYMLVLDTREDDVMARQCGELLAESSL